MIKSIFLSIIFVLSLSTTGGVVSADTFDKPKPLEEFYPESGYKTIEAAAVEFERYFKQPLKLPLRVPPISFTHYFGRFQHTNDGMNDLFEVEVKNDKVPKNHYMIVVRPINQKIDFKGRTILGTYQLKNGKTATLYELGKMKQKNRKSSYDGFNVLVFERENWQYQLSIDRRVSNIVTPKVLVEIANTIDYPAERPIE